MKCERKIQSKLGLRRDQDGTRSKESGRRQRIIFFRKFVYIYIQELTHGVCELCESEKKYQISVWHYPRGKFISGFFSPIFIGK